MQLFHLRAFAAALFAVLAAALPAHAFEGENLLVGLPEGYKVAHQTEKGGLQMTEMIPKAEALDNWTEMLTVQVFHNDNSSTPRDYFDTMQKRFAQACGQIAAIEVRKGAENGYDFSFFQLTCPLNPHTGKPEYTWFKAMRGRDSFYVVQKAWKQRPSDEQIVEWSKFLRKVAVCDTRHKAQSCGLPETR